MPALEELKQISENLFFHPNPGAEPFDLPAKKQETCSTPGNEVFVDLNKQCIITRTSSGLYVSVQKDKASLDYQVALLERLARMHS